MNTKPVKYPVGRQNFAEIREEGFLYIDKTEYIYNLTHGDAPYIILSRPRRFGKSLLVSTLRSYFEGRRELFEGLAMEKLETEWRKYPVLQFDMSWGKHLDESHLEAFLDYQLREYEKIYGREPYDTLLNGRLFSLIRRAYEQTGEKVVVLIDAYDAPWLDEDIDAKQLVNRRNILVNFYNPLKDADPYLKFMFLTGSTPYPISHWGPSLNNLHDISLLERFSEICGITEDEMIRYMSEGIDKFAAKWNVGRDETIARLRTFLGGYRFTSSYSCLYEPDSLFNSLSKGELDYCRFGGLVTADFLKTMHEHDFKPSELGCCHKSTERYFYRVIEMPASIYAFLYRNGFYTIKEYDDVVDLYTLGLPNSDVRFRLMRLFEPDFATYPLPSFETGIAMFYGALLQHDIDGAFTLLQTFFKTVPYCNDIDHEGHWQQMLYVVFSLLGARCDVEVHTADGRVDLVAAMWGKLYLMEIKLDKPAGEALGQIDLKAYDRRFALYDLPVVKIGVCFSTKERTITEWVVE